MSKIADLKCHSRSGMTLVEIIIALAIFAIISVGFYGVFSTVFINMYNTSRVTESAFLSQQEIEERILDVKTKLKNGLVSQVTDDRISVTLFSGTNERSVYAYHLVETMVNGKVVETLVAENRPPQLEVPVITSEVEIATYRGTTRDNYPNIASRGDLVINLVGGTPTVDNEGILIQHLYYWYISKLGYYTPSTPPLFPDDYEILAGYTSKDILTVPESFGGRFLKLMVTPVGEKGAMGDSVVSNDLFISPLPVYSTLMLHYDASWINRNASNEYSSDRVQRWLDIGPYRSASANPSGSLPTITLHEYEQEIIKRTYGVVRSSSTGTQQLITSSNSSIPNRTSVTVYLVTKFSTTNGAANNVTFLTSRDGNNRDKFILKTSNVSGFQGQLELIKWNNTTQVSVINQSNYRTDQWEIIKLEVYSNRLAIRHAVSKVEDVYSFVNTSENTSFNTSRSIILTPFKMTFAQGYTIGEVMIYDGVVSNDDEQKILKYLYDKFMQGE